jgi:hypothetical protein
MSIINIVIPHARLTNFMSILKLVAILCNLFIKGKLGSLPVYLGFGASGSIMYKVLLPLSIMNKV